MPGFLYVYIIARFHGCNVVYKLHYFSFVVIYLKVTHFKYNNIHNETNLKVSLMKPPAVHINALVSLKVRFSKQWCDGNIETIPKPQPPTFPWPWQRGALKWAPYNPIPNSTILHYLYMRNFFCLNYLVYQYKYLLTVYIWVLET